MKTHMPFTIRARADELSRSWNFSVQSGYEDLETLNAIARELFEIPVNPLPDPFVSGNDMWHKSMNIGDYDFADTWNAYLDVLCQYGTICHTQFEYLRLPEDEQPAPPRPQCAAVIDVKLHNDNWENQLYLMVTIYATGRVECLGMDENRYQERS